MKNWKRIAIFIIGSIVNGAHAQDSTMFTTTISFDTAIAPDHYFLDIDLMENGSFVKTGKKLRKQWKNMTLDSLQQMLQSELNKLGSKQEVTLQGISGAQFYYCPGRLQGSYRLVFYKLDTIRDLLTVLSRNENFCGMNKFLVTPVITESHIEIVKASLENKYLGHMFAHRVEYPNRTGFEFAELKYYSSWFKLKMAHNPALYNQQQKTTLINFVLPVYTFTGSFSIRLKRKD